MRWWGLLSVLAGCGVTLQGGDIANKSFDAGTGDAPDAPDAPAPAPVLCTDGNSHATAPDASCLMLVTGEHTWTEAQAACSALNAHLVILRNPAMNTAAIQLVGTIDAYIGLTDEVTEGTFLWVNGTPATFTNWRAGEPSEGDGAGAYPENCAVIAGTRADPGWDDRPCAPLSGIGGGNYAALCQR